MTGQELLEILSQMTPEQLAGKIVPGDDEWFFAIDRVYAAGNEIRMDIHNDEE